jgi:hypothetical protein
MNANTNTSTNNIIIIDLINFTSQQHERIEFLSKGTEEE